MDRTISLCGFFIFLYFFFPPEFLSSFFLSSVLRVRLGRRGRRCGPRRSRETDRSFTDDVWPGASSSFFFCIFLLAIDDPTAISERRQRRERHLDCRSRATTTLIGRRRFQKKTRTGWRGG